MIIINGIELKKDYFSNSEVRIYDFKNYIHPNKNCIELKYETENPKYKINDDLMILYFVKNYFDSLNISVDKLLLWSMPYQRMDNKIDGYLHTLPYIAKFISNLDFKMVEVIEPHSILTSENLYRYKCTNQRIFPVPKWLRKLIFSEELDITECIHIVFPDKGAYERYKLELPNNEDDANDFSKISGKKIDICVFTKQREYTNNEIIKHELSFGKIEKGSTCFIIDDICSSGKTLLDVANEAKKCGASKIYIIVAHCENEALKGDLLKEDSPVTKLFTSKSMIHCQHPKIEYLDIERWIL